MLHPESIRPPYFAPRYEPQNEWKRKIETQVKAYAYVRARTNTAVHACIPSLWRGSLKRTGFAGEHIPYTLTRALSCLSYASIPGVISGRIDLRTRLSRASLFPHNSLSLFRPLENLEVDDKTRAVLFERASYLSRLAVSH